MNCRDFTSVALLAVASLVLAACGENVASGENDEIELRYPAETITFFKSLHSLAEGSKLQLDAFEVREGKDSSNYPVTLDSVSSSKPSVLEVTSVSDATFTVEAKKVGKFKLTVDGENVDGESIEDTFTSDVKEPMKIETEAYCPRDGEVYLAGGEAEIGLSLLDGDDEYLAGYGLFPISASPASASVVSDYVTPRYAQIELRDDAGDTTIKPDGAGDPLKLKTIPVGDVDDLSVHITDFDTLYNASGDTGFAIIKVWSQDRGVCQPTLELEVTTKTKEICELSIVDRATGFSTLQLPVDEKVGLRSILKVVQKESGTCKGELTAPDADAGEGVSVEFPLEL